MKKIQLIAFLMAALPCICFGQFSSGSTGADGVLDLSTMTCQYNRCEIQLPESGILNYTTINVPAGKELRFKQNSRNTPVTLLAQGNVMVAGTIQVSAPSLVTYPYVAGNLPGPGGFYGGSALSNGFGPAGGTSTRKEGLWIGPLSLNPIVGGSGGYGDGSIGGGGGGAVVLASSGTISITGGIASSGGISDGYNVRGTLGAGGAIRVVANTLNVSGVLFACNYADNPNTPVHNCGAIRMEAPQNQLNFTGTSTPAATLFPFTSNNTPTVTTGSLPQLMIQSIGGYSVPSYSGTRFDTVDLLLPNQIPDPVSVVVRANNIPLGSSVSVGFVSGSSNGTSTPCSLAGTEANSQCTATISNLNRTGVTYLLATAIFSPPNSLAKYNPKGRNEVAKIRLESVLGAKPKYVFLRTDNTVIDAAKLSKEFLQNYRM